MLQFFTAKAAATCQMVLVCAFTAQLLRFQGRPNGCTFGRANLANLLAPISYRLGKRLESIVVRQVAIAASIVEHRQLRAVR
jgi:hypothetical protein